MISSNKCKSVWVYDLQVAVTKNQFDTYSLTLRKRTLFRKISKEQQNVEMPDSES